MHEANGAQAEKRSRTAAEIIIQTFSQSRLCLWYNVEVEEMTMTLYDYLNLMPEGEELTVWDKDYDMETYFYGGKPDDAWDKAMSDLSQLLTITEIRSGGVIVNLSEVIENNMDKLEKADLFTDYDIDIIMAEMERDIAGNVSESWMQKFVDVLK